MKKTVSSTGEITGKAQSGGQKFTGFRKLAGVVNVRSESVLSSHNGMTSYGGQILEIMYKRTNVGCSRDLEMFPEEIGTNPRGQVMH